MDLTIRIVRPHQTLTASGHDAGTITITWHLADGTDAEILNWLDGHSRYLLSCSARAPVSGNIIATNQIDPTRNYWHNTMKAPGRWPRAST